MGRVYAFTDESGNDGFDFDKPDISTHFIVTAILVNEDSISDVTAQAEIVRKQFFQTGEMKSSSVGKNHKRRVSILNGLLKCNFEIFSVVVDKRKIFHDSGLMYKKTFYKFINNLVHMELRSAFKVLTVCADEIGGNEYMLSFSRYVKDHEEVGDLFGNKEFYFEDSKNSVLVQIADIVSGTLSFVYEHTKITEGMPDYLKILEKAIIRIENWPKSIDSYIYTQNAINKNYNQTIAALSLQQAQNFINANSDSDEDDVILQTIVLKYLCFRFINNDKRKYISTKELLNNLNYRASQNIGTHYFRTKIIAKLRDAGVIISSSQKGYKIPSTEEELYDFINHGTSVIMPMLERLRKCRDTVKIATMGELDLFDHTEYETLNRFFDKNEGAKLNDIE